MNKQVVKDQKHTLWIIITASGMVLLLFLVVLATIQIPSRRGEVASSAVQEGSASQGPVQFMGKVSDVIGSRTFILDSYGPLSEKVLVISRDPLMPVGGGGVDDFFFKTNDTVSITGEVRPFHLRALEEELGIDLSDDKYRSWQGRSVVVAERVEKE